METVRIVTEDTLGDAAVDGVGELSGPNADMSRKRRDLNDERAQHIAGKRSHHATKR